MYYFDIIILIILAGYIINGIRRGFFHEVLGLVGVLGGIIAGVLATPSLSELIWEFLPDFPDIAIYLISFTLLFTGFYFITRVLANLLKSLSENLFLGWLNNLMGGLAAGLKGALFLSLVFSYIAFLPWQKWLDDVEDESRFYKPIYKFVPFLYETIGSPDELPDEVWDILEHGGRKILEEKIEDLKDEMEDAVDI
ncbi:MAG: CvpA family protein [Calditrichaeota bacterium]|nr:MAG: CvpA family protein [Calditrichota bacterium]